MWLEDTAAVVLRFVLEAGQHASLPKPEFPAVLFMLPAVRRPAPGTVVSLSLMNAKSSPHLMQPEDLKGSARTIAVCLRVAPCLCAVSLLPN